MRRDPNFQRGEGGQEGGEVPGQFSRFVVMDGGMFACLQHLAIVFQMLYGVPG